MVQERINAFKSEAMVLCRERVERPHQAGRRAKLTQLCAVSAEMWMLSWSLWKRVERRLKDVWAHP